MRPESDYQRVVFSTYFYGLQTARLLSGENLPRDTWDGVRSAQRQYFPIVERDELYYRYSRRSFLRSTAWQN